MLLDQLLRAVARAADLRALERVSAFPGVQQAAFAWGVPLTGNNWPARVEIEGMPAADSDAQGATG